MFLLFLASFCTDFIIKTFIFVIFVIHGRFFCGQGKDVLVYLREDVIYLPFDK